MCYKRIKTEKTNKKKLQRVTMVTAHAETFPFSMWWLQDSLALSQDQVCFPTLIPGSSRLVSWLIVFFHLVDQRVEYDTDYSRLLEYSDYFFVVISDLSLGLK